MGYRVKRESYSDGRTWRLIHIVDHGSKIVDGKRKKNIEETTIHPDDLKNHTFNKKWSYEQAKAHHNKLKAKEKLNRAKTRSKVNAKKRIAKLKLLESAFLPKAAVAEFIEFLCDRMGVPKTEDKLPFKMDSHWMAAQKMIMHVELEPEEYSESPHKFYQYCIEKKLSPSWLKKVLRVVNLWGYFVSKRNKKAFLPVPSPQGQWRKNIKKAYQKKVGRESAPLTPQLLNSVKHTDDESDNDKMKTRHWNWMWISMFTGCRPSEIDRMLNDKNNQFHKITKPDENGIKSLCIFQVKLDLDDEDKWKSIPILMEEQAIAIEMIRSQNFKRPLTRQIHKFFGEIYNCYAGRKGFLDLILNPAKHGIKGVAEQKFENGSIWLGHRSLDRSLRDYLSKKEVHYDLPSGSQKNVRLKAV